MIVGTSVRLRSRVSDAAVRSRLKGKVLDRADYDVLLTGAARVSKPDGSPLCVYLPGAALAQTGRPEVYEVLTKLRKWKKTDDRGAASGTRKLKDPSGRGRALPVHSVIAGSIDPLGQRLYCRLTSWTGANLPEWELLQPLLQTVAAHFAEQVPERYAEQARRAADSDPAWIVPGTPFSTITVNNTYPTGVHQDSGDLPEGFSTLTCLRRGSYTGGTLIFPAYRVGVDMGEGDVLLMDAHEWHGNVPIVCACGDRLNGPCARCGAERISVVSYFRSKITDCGTPSAEQARATARKESPAAPSAAPSANA